MTGGDIALALGAGAGLASGLAFAAWRWWWFWRNPPRSVPAGDDLVSPADGTVAYVRRVAPDEPVVSIKKGVAASINDIVREDLATPKILIGIFMGPFDVHMNRSPMAGVVESTRQHPAIGRNRFMGSMLLRSWLGLRPLHVRSPHIVSNNRAVTRIAGTLAQAPAWCYVVQIGSFGASGIDVHPEPGQSVAKGEVFSMIRIGSQVDLVVPARDDFEVAVREGQRVRAGETVVVRVGDGQAGNRGIGASRNKGIEASGHRSIEGSDTCPCATDCPGVGQSVRMAHVEAHAIVVAGVLAKKTGKTPKRVIDGCASRLRVYDRVVHE